MTTTNPAPAAAHRATWRTVNISTAERGGRIVLGLAATIAGIVLLLSVGSVLAGVLEVLLVLAGLDLVITGTSGHCPLYQKLGHIPASLRSTRNSRSPR